jgi:phage terminase small subunit
MADVETVEKSAFDSLSGQHQMFVLAYLTSFNATQAAIAAQYSERTARFQGSRLLTNVNIKAAIAEKMEQLAMPAAEVLGRLAGLARLDLSPFIKTVPAFVNEEGKPLFGETLGIDLNGLKTAGYGWTIKGVKATANGPVIEFHDSFAALQLIGKHHKLFAERGENLNVDLSTLSDDQLTRLERGENIYSVLRSA